MIRLAENLQFIESEAGESESLQKSGRKAPYSFTRKRHVGMQLCKQFSDTAQLPDSPLDAQRWKTVHSHRLRIQTGPREARLPQVPGRAQNLGSSNPTRSQWQLDT